MLQKSKVNFILDFYYGSSGKGQVATAIADRERPEILTANHATSASHTVIDEDSGTEFVFKALPTASVLNRIRSNYNPLVVIPSSSVFELEQIKKEIEYCKLTREQVIIHPRAVVLSQAHADSEKGDGGTVHLGSTMSGQSYAVSEKITRKANTKLAKDYEELSKVAMVMPDDYFFPTIFMNAIINGQTILAEMPQGYPLSIDHGPMYPYSTFRNITPTQFMADIGIAHTYVGAVVGNIRSLPIRVSNRFQNDDMSNVEILIGAKDEDTAGWVRPESIGMDYSDVNAITYDVAYLKKEVNFGNHIITDIKGVIGTSGPFEPDMKEISWRELSEDLTKKAGKDHEVHEITTLTKLTRRVAKMEDPDMSISQSMLKKFLTSCNPTHFAVTFMNYIDPNIEGITDAAYLNDSEIVRDWATNAIVDIQTAYMESNMNGFPAIHIIQTGKDLKNVLFL